MKTRIAYEDRELLICHKPAGLATQSASVSQPDMASELKKYLGGGYVGIIHRLDQPVEGLLAVAKNKGAAAALSRQLAAGELCKQYCALAYGKPPREQGELADYLRKEGGMAHVVGEGAPDAKRAVLRYQVRQGQSGPMPPGNYTCLDIYIGTGRFHQIRCQLSHAGMPILGDQKYGTAESLEEGRRLGLGHVALCAYRLRLLHPSTGREVSCEIRPGWLT